MVSRIDGWIRCGALLTGVHPEMVDFGSGQGRSNFDTDDAVGVARRRVVDLRRGFQKRENAGRGRKMPFLDGH